MAFDGEDHSDVDSLFGDSISDDEAQEVHPPRAVISFPRAPAISQNVGTIAPSPVPSSSEHHSSGSLSSASILLTRSSVQPCSKRNASPLVDHPNKKRRVEPNDSASSKVRAVKNLAGSFGVPASGDRPARAEALQTVLNLFAPRTKPQFRPYSRASTQEASGTPATCGLGTAIDPVVVPEDNSPVEINPNQVAVQPPTSRRITRSQEAHTLLEALPNDPKDILSKTLRNILKTPTMITHSRISTPRDIAAYLANGRYTGTPFLRLLRHLAGPNRLKNPKYGLEQLKKLVEGMRMTEGASRRAAVSGQPGQSSTSAASTPMPATPNTPAVTSFALPGASAAVNQPEFAFSPDLFAFPDFGINPASIDMPWDSSKQPFPDIVIDPQLLAISQDSSYLQPTPNDIQSFDLNLDEILGALPPPPVMPEPLPNATEATAAVDFVWDDLPPVRLDLGDWSLQPVPPVPQPVAPSNRPFKHANQITQMLLKQADLPPGGMRIPPRSEALVLLERARARKAEIEAKLKIARRQAWGCMVESAVERNLLSRLQD